MRPLKAKTDIYVLKYGDSTSLSNGFISDLQDFVYRTYGCYRKTLRDKLRAFFAKKLHGTVYHTYSIKESKFKTASFPFNNPCITNSYGVFKILKGTSYYISAGGAHFGTFEIEYIGQLTEENKHLILNQQ